MENNLQNNNQDIQENAFLHSLDVLEPDSIAPPMPPKKLTASAVIKRSIYYAVMTVCIAIFIIVPLYIGKTLYDYKRADDIYSGLEDQFSDILNDKSILSHMTPVDEDKTTPNYATALTMTEEDIEKLSSKNNGTSFAQVKSKLNALMQQNQELYGWITIEGTRINYPIVQHTDNDYYLNYAYTGDYLPAGSIFVDYRCNKSIMRNFNTVIYGHHMNNGTMFNNLDYYFDENFFNNNPYIYIYTLEGIYKYEVFAVYETTMTYKYIDTDFLSAEDFVAFANEMKENSVYQREGITFNEFDRMLTLSTCTNRGYDERICVQAKLISWQ